MERAAVARNEYTLGTSNCLSRKIKFPDDDDEIAIEFHFNFGSDREVQGAL